MLLLYIWLFLNLLTFCFSGSFDVYNIETALPKLDLDAIENHLKAAKEAERRVCNFITKNEYYEFYI